MVADPEQVDEMDASEFHAEQLSAKEMILHKLGKRNNPNPDGTVGRRRDSNHDAASSSQGWQKYALLDRCTGKPVATVKP